MAIAILRTTARGRTSGKVGYQYLDYGTSGGLWSGRGYCLMVGGSNTSIHLSIFEPTRTRHRVRSRTDATSRATSAGMVGCIADQLAQVTCEDGPQWCR